MKSKLKREGEIHVFTFGFHDKLKENYLMSHSVGKKMTTPSPTWNALSHHSVSACARHHEKKEQMRSKGVLERSGGVEERAERKV